MLEGSEPHDALLSDAFIARALGIRRSSSRMMSLELLSWSPSTLTMGTFVHSLLNLISDLVSGFTSTTSYGTPWKSSIAFTLLQKGHTSYW